MKLTLANYNQAFSRTQWLLIICLAVVAFDFGARYATKQYTASSAAKSPATNIAVTNLLLTATDPTLEVVETNYYLPAETNVVRVQYTRPTNTYVPPPAVPRTPPGVPEILVDKRPTKRAKLPTPRTNSPIYGIRIVVP